MGYYVYLAVNECQRNYNELFLFLLSHNDDLFKAEFNHFYSESAPVEYT